MIGARIKITVPDGTERTWRSLWRSRPRERVLFAGYITGGKVHRHLNSPAIAMVEAVDALASLDKK